LPENAESSTTLGGAAIGVASAIGSKPKSNDAPITNPTILKLVIGSLLLLMGLMAENPRNGTITILVLRNPFSR
jgi:hypothetical protein